MAPAAARASRPGLGAILIIIIHPCEFIVREFQLKLCCLFGEIAHLADFGRTSHKVPLRDA